MERDKNNGIIDFEGRLDPSDKMNEHQESTFKEDSKAVLLPNGLVLHRLAGKHNPIGSFWIDDKTFGDFMNSLRQMEMSVKEKQFILRNDMGLLKEWKNTLSRRLKITLKKETVAHRGLIGPQYSYVEIDPYSFALNTSGGKIEKCIEWRRGGHYQYVIPSIAKAEINNTEKHGFEINADKQLFNMKNIHRK